jgi:transmembrane sensor
LEAKTIRRILKNYLLGNVKEQEKEAVDTWYESFDQEAPITLSEQERVSAKQEIWEKIAPTITVDKKVRVMTRFMKVATWAAIATGVVFTFFYIKNRQPSKQAAVTYTTISTKNGEKSTVTIKDGTQLTLNAGTTIHVYDDFSATRRVDLVDGEVFFEVKRDEQRPFRIYSDSLNITVLGTSFNVSAYKELNNISVGVVSGKVRVKKDTTTLNILQKAQELVYDKNLHTHKTIPFDESLLAWREGRISLNDLSFREMAFLMKKNFGIDIVTEDRQIMDSRYTTELFSTMTADQVVEVLAAIHNLKIKKINNQIYFLK